MEKKLDKEVIEKEKRLKLIKNILIVKFTILYCCEKLYVFSKEQKYIKPIEKYHEELEQFIIKYNRRFTIDLKNNTVSNKISKCKSKYIAKKIKKILNIYLGDYNYEDAVKYVDDSLARDKNDELHTIYSEIIKTKTNTLPFSLHGFIKPTFIKIE